MKHTSKYFRLRLLFLFLVIFLVAFIPPISSHTEKHQTMKQQLNEYITNEPNLHGSLVGISIRSAETGEKLYDHRGDTRFRPASNMKLLTGAAALSVLGEDYTFPTEILTDGTVTGNKLQGNLYIKGKGDPTLLPSDFDTFAAKLKETGIEVIEGNIIGDDTWYDDVRLSPDINWSDEQYYYGSQVSALTASPTKDYDSGSIIVEITPGSKVEKKPKITLFPETDYIQIVNKATTVSANGDEDLLVERAHGENTITIKGSIPVGSAKVKEWMSVWEPTGYALDLFQRSLKKQGITWTKNVRSGKAPENTTRLFSHQSMPLSDLFVPFMKLSNNGHAEILVKEIGKTVYGEGSWEKGIEVMEAELAKLGMNTDTIIIRDGSGISHVNSLPPNEVSNLLYAVQEEEWFANFHHSLPVAGNEDRMIGGTLRNRLEGISVQAKTGTIDGVSTLSGYTDTKRGGKLIFSIMINHLLDEDEGKDVENTIVEIIANEAS